MIITTFIIFTYFSCYLLFLESITTDCNMDCPREYCNSISIAANLFASIDYITSQVPITGKGYASVH